MFVIILSTNKTSSMPSYIRHFYERIIGPHRSGVPNLANLMCIDGILNSRARPVLPISALQRGDISKPGDVCDAFLQWLTISYFTHRVITWPTPESHLARLCSLNVPSGGRGPAVSNTRKNITHAFVIIVIEMPRLTHVTWRPSNPHTQQHQLIKTRKRCFTCCA